MTTRLGYQIPDHGNNSGIATLPNCRYLFYSMNQMLEKASLRLNYSVFPYGLESSEWHLKEDIKPDAAFSKAVGVCVVREVVLLCGGLLSAMPGMEPACVMRYVLSAGEKPVVRVTAVSLMLQRLPAQGGTQSCTQHRTAVLEHSHTEAL